MMRITILKWTMSGARAGMLALGLAGALALGLGCSRAQPGTQRDDHDPRHAPDHGNDSTAKNPDRTPGSKKGSTMSSWQKVKDWAGDSASVGHVEDINVPGMEFFFINESGPSDIGRGGGVVVAGDKILKGKDAMRAVLEQKPAPMALAQAALLLLGKGGKPLAGATTDEHRQAGVAAPAVAGDVLTFYWESPGINSQELMRGTLQLGSLELGAAPAKAAAGDEVAEAQRMLDGQVRSMYRLAIDKLAACNDPRAAGVLAKTVQGHANAEARGHAAEVMARCHDKSSVAALVKALESDKDNGVRWRAATTLGALGDASAVPALKRASNDADPNVGYAAKTALGKLQ